ncbi:Srd anti-sigma factor [Proteus phage phiP4-3]|uniref:Anti-sigma factor n=1 Tax=Proteus phage phiP4-3 TaxID=2065203 RepID=A0A2I6PFV7_9CAUD|nr:Srd anti-sigma factor [Proteus phage phiP4-3]AUM58613.1 anti-sigma factor [Proteus phage phiP4-3]
MDSKQLSSKFKHLKQSAKARNKEFNLSKRYVQNICEQTKCAYSGEPISLTTKRNDPNALTFERFDNSKGYVKGNVIPIKGIYNQYKGDRDAEGLKAIIKSRENSKETTKAGLDRAQIKLNQLKKRLACCPNDRQLAESVKLKEAQMKRLNKEYKKCVKSKDKDITILKTIIKSGERFNKLSKLDKLKLYLGISLDSSYKRVGKELYVLLCDSLQRLFRI